MSAEDKFNTACAHAAVYSDEDLARMFNELVEEGVIPNPDGSKSSRPRTKTQKALDNTFSLYIHSMLSNPTTHIVNATSNTIPLVTRLVESPIIAAVSAIQKQDLSEFRTVMADVTGLVEGSTDAFRYIWKRASYIKNKQTRQQSLQEIGAPDALVYRNKAQAEGQLTEADPMNAAASDGGMKLAMQWLQVAAPGNQLANMDTFFKIITYRAEVSRMAMREALKRGGTPDEVSTHYAAIKESNLDNPSKEFAEQAIRAAEQATYTDIPALKLDRWMAESGHEIPGMRWVVPFRRTMVNIIKWGIQHSPAPLLAPRTYRQIMRGGYEAQEAIARMSAGTMLISTIYSMTGDNLHGQAPKNARARDLWERDGHKEYSITIGDSIIPLDSLGGFGLMLKAMASAQQSLSNLSNVADDGVEATMGEITTDVMLTFGEVMMSDHWMENILDGLDSLNTAFRDGDAKALTVYASKFVGALNPNVIKQQVTKRVDPYVKDINGPIESLIARVPYWSRNISNKVDLWGEPMVYDNFRDPAIASPITGKDPVSSYMRELGVKLPEPRRTVMGAKMTPKEYQHFMTIAGRGPMGMPPLRDYLDTTFRASWFHKLKSDNQRVKVIRSIINKYRQAARMQIINDPQFTLGQRVMAEVKRAQS